MIFSLPLRGSAVWPGSFAARAAGTGPVSLCAAGDAVWRLVVAAAQHERRGDDDDDDQDDEEHGFGSLG
jgi:hypothetical protein